MEVAVLNEANLVVRGLSAAYHATQERSAQPGSDSDRTGVLTTDQEILRPRRNPQEEERPQVAVQVGLRLTHQEGGLRR